MALKNKEILISNKIFIENNLFKQATGLMFKKTMKDFAMIFPFKNPRRITVTMFCVFFPIDVIFLDDKNNIIELKNNLKPFQNYKAKSNKISTFIEFPNNYISKYKLNIGNKIIWNKNFVKVLK